MLDWLPVSPGSYALHLRLDQPAQIVIGRLGTFDFPAGDYLYLGSAHGPGGLRARLRHHFGLSTRLHWHIDFLRSRCVIVGGWGCAGPGRLECQWSQALFGGELPGAVVVAPHFGAADCRLGCPAHLAAFPGEMVVDRVERTLGSTLPDGASLIPILGRVG